MRETFSEFCSNKDNQLVEFWDSISKGFEEKEEKRRRESNEVKRQLQEELDNIPTTPGEASNVTNV